MRTFVLDGTDWLLRGYMKNSWIAPESGGIRPDQAFLSVKATVPGAVQCDLMSAGLLPDPDIGLNSLAGEWVNNREWIYQRRFVLPGTDSKNGLPERRFRLELHGLDHSGEIRLNGRPVSRFSGMFLPVFADVTGLIRTGTEENVLDIIFEQSPEIDGQMGYSSRIRTLKSRFNYGWDWCARIVPVGIWDTVQIRETGPAYFKNVFPNARLSQDNLTGEIRLELEITAPGWLQAEVEVNVEGPGEEEHTCVRWPVELSRGVNRIARSLAVERVEPWWPNGLGPQALYRITTRLLTHGGAPSDEDHRRIGFRRIECRPNERAPEGARPYTVWINGRRLFLQGVNWVPVTPFYGREHVREYEGLLTLFQKMNCNILRVWGGAVLEKQRFYDLCDEKGLLVWQEFPQSSSGIDNTPPDDEGFLRDLKAVATSMICRRRHHASHAIWCGGNELFEPRPPGSAHNVPVDERHPNIEMLHELVQALDSGKIWLPCSPSGPIAVAQGGIPDVSHDVHGWWYYYGPEAHYAYYNADDALLRSEVGTPGANSVETLEKLSGPEPLWPPSKENRLWMHHGSWWVQWEEMCKLFGGWQEHEFPRYVWCSQYLQGESLRYILESNRRRQWRSSGSIIWMGNEPFANTANTAIVGVWGRLKPASAFVKRAFAPHHASLRYEKLFHRPGETFRAQVFAHNAGRELLSARLCVQFYELSGRKLAMDRSWDADVPAESTVELGWVDLHVPDLETGLFLVRLVLQDGVETLWNNYLFGTDHERPLQGLKQIQNTTLHVQVVEEGCPHGSGFVDLQNQGGIAAILPVLRSSRDLVYVCPEDEAQVLLPGERQRLSFMLKPRAEVGDNLAELRVEAMNAVAEPFTVGAQLR